MRLFMYTFDFIIVFLMTEVLPTVLAIQLHLGMGPSCLLGVSLVVL
jgi:hypothetical protein